MRRALLKLICAFTGIAANNAIAGAGTEPAYERQFMVGTTSVHELNSRTGKLSVVFEDDGETGYFYAIDPSQKDQPIQEALHIYNVRDVKDRQIPSRIRIAWSKSGMQAGLWINGYPHAIIDFAGKRGYCRTNFPRPSRWNAHDFSWSDDALRFFQ